MAGNTTQVRDISDSRTDGLQLALDRAAQAGFYPAFMWPWGSFTRIVFRRHPDTPEKAILPNAKRLSRRYRGDVAEVPTAEAQLALIEAMALDPSTDQRQAIADMVHTFLLGEVPDGA